MKMTCGVCRGTDGDDDLGLAVPECDGGDKHARVRSPVPPSPPPRDAEDPAGDS